MEVAKLHGKGSVVVYRTSLDRRRIQWSRVRPNGSEAEECLCRQFLFRSSRNADSRPSKSAMSESGTGSRVTNFTTRPDPAVGGGCHLLLASDGHHRLNPCRAKRRNDGTLAYARAADRPGLTGSGWMVEPYRTPVWSPPGTLGKPKTWLETVGGNPTGTFPTFQQYLPTS